ncbi:MAG: isoleucine--tRNA ligase [Phycisphaerae bacterium]
MSEFESVPSSFDFPKSEEKVLAFWNEREIFAKSQKQREGGKPFVFYEGPPTANGLPHPGHVLTRVIKDLLPRYKTMRGYYCSRKAGWDTHGLPVEIEVEKELGIDGKDQIEKYGVEPFVRKCFDSVFRYVREWEQLTSRIGFWIDMEHPYVTCSTDYVESVWWAISEIFKKGLLYKGYKIVPYCPRCGTVLSSHEVGLGYKDVEDPSIYVAFKTKSDPKESLLAWTTTPWTLISNAALVVRKEFDYARVKVGDEVLIMAQPLVKQVMGKVPHEIIGTVKGADLVGMEYEPLYKFTTPNKKAHYVVEAEFVTLDSGTGIVHCAPAFGADDYQVGLKFDLPVIQLVDVQGKFKSEVTPWAGMFIKQADPKIIEDLKKRGLLLRREGYKHSYPFCWRCDTPLMYYAREGWFIRTTEKKDKIIANNQKINWLPEHIKDGRFGNFLEDNIDWALSRERYWGTPLPVWICEKSNCGFTRAFGSTAELLKENPNAFDYFENRRKEDPSLPENMAVHKPFIDQVTLPCPHCGAKMKRTPEVIDCWFDSGCMPFAQWGYPHTGQEKFKNAFPADFISEAIDQTRGWFYSMLAISTLLFEDHPYRNCIVLGLVLGKDGKKLSKRLRNYDEPGKILDREGADALRWYFYFGQTPWTSARFDESAIAESQREFLIRLYNVYSFFVIYATIDGFSKHVVDKLPLNNPVPLDKWILAELNKTIKVTTQRLDELQINSAAIGLSEFVDALSNWYVRRSRNRFWKSGWDADKSNAYWTLYECLTTLSKLIAPFVPFFAETMYQNLERNIYGDKVRESVHLCDWPKVNETLIDQELLEEMSLVREIVALGRSARASEKVKVRQPLAEVELILADAAKMKILQGYIDLIQEELNVKSVKFVTEARQYVDYIIKPNFRAIGPKFGPLAPKIKQTLTTIDGGRARQELVAVGKFSLNVDGQEIELTSEEVEIGLQSHPGFAAAQGPDVLVVLKTEITDNLRLEGLARELIHYIQQVRKEMDLAYEARIELSVQADGEFSKVLTQMSDYIKSETLVTKINLGSGVGEPKKIDVEGTTLNLWVKAV